MVRDRLEISWSQAKRLVRDGRVRVGELICADGARRVKAGQTIEVSEGERGPNARTTSEPASARPLIQFADEHIVIVEKPAGLTTMRHPEEAEEFGTRAGRFLPTTLADLLPRLLVEEEGRKGKGLPRVLAVHRLDNETSGLVMFARTGEAARHLGRQLREHTIERRYLAVVRGEATDRRIESRFTRDRGDGRRGSTQASEDGQIAITHVRLRERIGDFSLVECRLETGRTHQVRIHLGETGTPLCGERIYDRPLHGKPAPDTSGAPRIALHAAVLGLTHPATGERLRWISPLPADLEQLLHRLRRGALDEPPSKEVP